MIRKMSLAELQEVLDWAAAEGWNPGREDAAPFLAADPDGFFVAEREGRPVAAISVVNHDPGMAFLGLYLCRPEWRGRGVGYALWQEALRHAEGRTVGLDGVAAQQANYARSGFAPAGATLRLEGRLEAGFELRDMQENDLPEVLALDRIAAGYDRRRFLSAWTARASSRRTVLEGQGFATARLCRRGCKVGPVIAPDAAAALRLIAGASAAVGSPDTVVDVPDDNTALVGLLADRGFRETFRTARMYRGPAPQGGPGLQAVGTLELG